MNKEIFLFAKGFSTIITFRKLLFGIGILLLMTSCFWPKAFPHVLTFKSLLFGMKKLGKTIENKVDFLTQTLKTSRTLAEVFTA